MALGTAPERAPGTHFLDRVLQVFEHLADVVFGPCGRHAVYFETNLAKVLANLEEFLVEFRTSLIDVGVHKRRRY